MLNYTTKIPAHQSIAEISRMLARAGAKAVMHEYDEQGYIKSLSFSMDFQGRPIGFKLPTDWQKIQPIMQDMRRKNSKLGTYIVEQDHCVNVAWRVVKDWIEAQLALIEWNQAKTQQIFLPYAVTKSGQTLYEQIESDPTMLLGPGDAH